MILTFQDGPASVGVAVKLGRCPLFLRVAVDAAGEMRGLDAINSEPAAGEVLHVYERIEPSAAVKKGAFDLSDIGSRTLPNGCCVVYRWMNPEKTDPPMRDEFIRTTEAWRSWCEAQRQRAVYGPTGGPGDLGTGGQATKALFDENANRVV